MMVSLRSLVSVSKGGTGVGIMSLGALVAFAGVLGCGSGGDKKRPRAGHTDGQSQGPTSTTNDAGGTGNDSGSGGSGGAGGTGGAGANGSGGGPSDEDDDLTSTNAGGAGGDPNQGATDSAGAAGGAGDSAGPGGTTGGGLTADVVTTDATEWEQLAGGQIITIDFEDALPGQLTGTEWNALPGAPALVSVSGEGLYIGVAGTTYAQIPTAPSGTQMLLPIEVDSEQEPGEGIIRFDFDSPVRSFAATFIDVEADFATTGIGFDGAQSPRLHFPEQPATDFAFLGIVLSDPVTSLAIHFATGASIDGVLVDDVRYVLQEE
jgi:hypothetical protein